MARKMKHTISMLVTVELPPGATTQDGMEFIRDAIKYNFKGEKLPEDYCPMDELDKEKVRVSLFKSVKEYA